MQSHSKHQRAVFLISWQNNYKFHLKSNCVRMAKNFPLRKMKTNRSKREVMISCTHFETQVGWEPGPAPRSPALSCMCRTRGRRGFLSVASVRVCLSTAPCDWASPQEGGLRSQMCTAAARMGVRAGSRQEERDFVRKGSRAHTLRLKSLLWWERGEPGETQKLSNQWKCLLATVGWYSKI